MSYEKFVTNYRRHTHHPRTLDEAFKTADYATPIWRCETENDKGLRKLGETALMVMLVCVSMLVLYGFVVWLENIK
jgi:hypothetical protein